MKQTTFEEFVDLAKRATFVPVVKELVADLLTPVSAFLKVAEHSDYAFLLESVEGGEHVGRYSFLGKDPFLILRGRNGQTVMERAGVTTDAGKPFVDTLRELMNSFQSPFVPGLPRFTGGAVGYFGYETAAWFEPTAARDGATAPADRDDAGFMVFDTVLAFDHVQHRILLIANARISPDEDLRSLYQFACAKIEFLESELERALSLKRPKGGETVTLTPNMSQEAYEAIVRRAKEYIAAGDIYQVVLSRRFEADVSVDAFTVYRALRHVNPSPYMFFIRMGERSIVGASPEMLVRVEGRHAVTHPIAGTRRRGATEEEDLRLADELKRNEKERAEHVMLVDLGRNDIGRVCDYGTRARADVHGPREVLARDAHGVGGRGPARRRPRSSGRAGLVLPRGHGVGRAEGARHADHQRARAECTRPLCRRRRLPGLRRQPRFLHRDPLDLAGTRQGLHPVRRRHCRRLEPDGGVRRDARQGARDDSRARIGAGGLIETMVLVIDNYDSFTYNLVQYLGELGAKVVVRRNDEASIAQLRALTPARVVISPGPGRPEQAGVSLDVIREFGPHMPVLGRVPGPPGHWPRVWRRRGARARADSRQDLHR